MSTPIIITVPNNYLAMDEDSLLVETPHPSRKRRLDHLSWEERMQRKKLKNRVAAQTSRDRKKARMDDMENSIQLLMAANERLTSELESLKTVNERLLCENAELRSAAAARCVAGAPGPAESPRQKEGPPPAHRAALLLATLLLWKSYSNTSTLPTTWTPSLNSLTPSSKKLMAILQERIKMSQAGTLESVLKQLKWWGPQQSTWNPVKVQS